MQDIGLAAAVIPRYPGVNSALGCVMSDLRHDEVRTLNTMLDALNCKEVNGLIQAMTQMGHSIIKKSKAQLDATESVIELDMLYMGQTHAVAVPIPSDKPISPDLIRAAFEATYLKTYSRLLDQIPIRIRARRQSAKRIPRAARHAGVLGRPIVALPQRRFRLGQTTGFLLPKRLALGAGH